jgi:hypothetical protein
MNSAQNSAVGSEGYEFPIIISLDDERFAASAVDDANGGFAILNPGEVGPQLWPAERFDSSPTCCWKNMDYGRLSPSDQARNNWQEG